ncbi:hypothetical protein [Wenyingzhuangia sp. IMCC45574]
MNWISAVLDLIGIGKKAIENRAKRKLSKIESENKINEAKTFAEVKRIESITASDNSIDFESVKQMQKSWKDEFLMTIVYTPFAIVIIVPFITAYKTGNWENLNTYMIDSFKTLNDLPEWYPWIAGLILIATFGFRSILRRGIEAAVQAFIKRINN